MKEIIELYFDGACEPINPGGTASCGFLIKKDNKVISSGSKIIGSGDGMTNNVGEYHGLIEGLKAFSKLNINEKLVIHGDSTMVCKMVSKEWGWNKKKTEWIPHKDKPHLKKLLEEVLIYLNGKDYKAVWVPREKNQEADILSKEPLIAAGILGTEKELSSICPKCGALMVLRLAQRGTNAGNHFYGCSHYPKCTFTKGVEKNEIK